MDTISLKYFMEIASGQTFWEVSENHNISQSSVSKAILRLEDELGVKLFSRDKRVAALTPAGTVFFESLQKLEPEFHKTLQELVQFTHKKEIKLGIVPNVDYMDLNMRIPGSAFFQKYPDVNVLFSGETSGNQARLKLDQEQLDFLIEHRFKDREKHYDLDLVCHDTLYAIFPKDHPLAGRESVSFQELMAEKILIRSIIIQNVIQEICDSIGTPLPPNMVIFDVPPQQMRRDHLVNRVAFGHGITLYFLSDLYIFSLKHVSVVPVTGCPEFPIALLRKKGRKVPVYMDAFREYLCNEIFANKDWLINR